MLKKILLFIMFFIPLFGGGEYSLDKLVGSKCGGAEFTYYRFLIDENSYAEIMRSDSRAYTAESAADALGVNVVRRENVGGTEILFGYAAGLSGVLILDGKRINIQIADNGIYLLIGSPYIPDGF
ncbi:MAG: hypothetical protein LBT20_08855 [Clostridiales bacterium]|jgi:hypothetical protein|nr:hypothetical protein [Clostridiales bacterium]